MKDETRRKFLITSIGSMGGVMSLVYACENRKSGGPLGPSGIGISSTSSFQVIPSSVSVIRGGSQTFSASGGTEPYSWSISDLTLGSIDGSTGIFTAGNTTGTLNVTATDSLGQVGIGTIAVTTGFAIQVNPATMSLRKGDSQTFTATGGTNSFTWSVGNTSLGSVTSTGSFTAGNTNGSVSVIATDDAGAVGSGVVTIYSPNIIVTPSVLTIPNSVTVPFTQTFSASGGTSPYYYTISGLSATYTDTAMDFTTGVLTVTTLPTTADETVTITATDIYGDTGTATVTIIQS